LMAEVQKGDEPHILFSGRVRTSRRVAVTFIVDSASMGGKVPAVGPITDPPPDLLPFLGAAPLFQARSILVREFLETHVGPVLKKGTAPFLESIFDVTRRELAWHRDGRSLALDVIRAHGGKRIGIERVFTTFLRCAGIPARFVEGIDLKSHTRKKRVFWTEVWAQDMWWPLSASKGWIGRMPRSYVALARNGTRVLEVEGPATASYAVFAQPRREELVAVR
jgi:Transglutaminase-like superfamily